MEELLAVGTFWFWILIAAEILILLGFTQAENGAAATVSLVVFLAILQFYSKVDLLGYAKSNPLHIVFGLLAYVGIGISWMIFKWRMFVKDRLRIHDEMFAEFLHKKNLPAETKVLPVEFRRDWVYTLERSKDPAFGQTVAETPLVRHNKARVMRWMSLWVFSVFLYFFFDMVKEVFSSVYRQLASFLQRSADNIYNKRDLKENLEIPKNETKSS